MRVETQGARNAFGWPALQNEVKAAKIRNAISCDGPGDVIAE